MLILIVFLIIYSFMSNFLSKKSFPTLFSDRVVRHPQRLLPLSAGVASLPERVRQRLLWSPAQWRPRGGRGSASTRTPTKDSPHVPQEDRRGDHAEPREILCPAAQTVHRPARLTGRRLGGCRTDNLDFQCQNSRKTVCFFKHAVWKDSLCSPALTCKSKASDSSPRRLQLFWNSSWNCYKADLTSPLGEVALCSSLTLLIFSEDVLKDHWNISSNSLQRKYSRHDPNLSLCDGGPLERKTPLWSWDQFPVICDVTFGPAGRKTMVQVKGKTVSYFY